MTIRPRNPYLRYSEFSRVGAAPVVLLLAMALSVGICFAATEAPSGGWDSGSPRYREEALLFMLKEANAYASLLALPEDLPISLGSLTEKLIASERVASRFGALGSLHTARFSYGFGKGRRLCYVTRLPGDGTNRAPYDRLKPWAIHPSQVDTNAAYALATQFLTRAFVDVPRLSESAKVSVHPIRVRNMTTSIYNISWERDGTPVAEITLAQPERELWLLRIEEPELISRKPFGIPNSNSTPTLPRSAPEKTGD
jgi:hypothetical protein